MFVISEFYEHLIDFFLLDDIMLIYLRKLKTLLNFKKGFLMEVILWVGLFVSAIFSEEKNL